MTEGQERQSPGGKFGLVRRLEVVLCGTDGIRERPPCDSNQVAIWLCVGGLLVFGVLGPANAAIAHGIRLDLALSLNLVHLQPIALNAAHCHPLTRICGSIFASL